MYRYMVPVHKMIMEKGMEKAENVPKLVEPTLMEFPISYYRKGRKLGKGSYGSVRQYDKVDKAPPDLPAHVAVKKIDGSFEKDTKALGEITILRRASHRNIVKFYGYFKISEDQTGIVMELCHGTLKNLIRSSRRLTVLEVVYLLYQVLSGLSHLHNDLGILHRDIKPENILIQEVDNDTPVWITVHVTKLILKLSDFGLSHSLTQSKASNTVTLTPQGTFPYMSPEIKRAFLVNERAPFSKYADIWACGMLAICMLTGETAGPSIMSTDSNFKEENFDTYILSMLKDNKRDRPSVKELLSSCLFEAATQTDKLVAECISKGDFMKLAKYLKIANIEDLTMLCLRLAETGELHKLTTLKLGGFDVVGVSGGFGTTLHYAALKEQLETVRALCKWGADANIKGSCGMMALHWACWMGNFGIVQFLVSNVNADVNAKDDVGDSPLHYASFLGHLTVVEYLSKNNADVNVPNAMGYTPLHYAAIKQHLLVVQFLVQKCKQGGANAITLSGDTPLDFACENNGVMINSDQSQCTTIRQMSVVHCLAERGGTTSKNESKVNQLLLLYAAYKGNLADVKKLTENYRYEYDSEDSILYDEYDHNIVTYIGKRTPLHLACYHGHLSIVKHFMQEIGGDIADVNARDNRKYTPLHLACSNGHLPIVKHLIQNRADIDVKARDCRDNTPLHLACSSGHWDILQYWVEEGLADVKAKNYDDKTPLQVLKERTLLQKNSTE